MGTLTPKQQSIYDFLCAFLQEAGYSPSVREIGEHLGLKSPSSVKFHLNNLRDAGLIQWEDGKNRSITLTDSPHAPRRNQVPLVGSVAAGAPIWAEECIEDYIPFETGPHPEDYFALRVRGESMLGAGILPDDLVVIHRQGEARNGEIVVALFEDEATVKTFSRKGNQVWLLPENPDYSPIDGSQAQIIGKVVALVRRY
ncbi:MAG: transcriptional repressor LexA [Evtepia sp.]|uniref:transcriptional repressor LexA n=1 Tax=Evtepia sp. TaxID=2773933 RepID=UPI002A758F85|nr:transcriptional repressor LexA [Evtepia sp.]MDY3015417.1 transcriptional repressor LexA [Evtepia sp.]